MAVSVFHLCAQALDRRWVGMRFAWQSRLGQSNEGELVHGALNAASVPLTVPVVRNTPLRFGVDLAQWFESTPSEGSLRTRPGRQVLLFEAPMRKQTATRCSNRGSQTLGKWLACVRAQASASSYPRVSRLANKVFRFAIVSGGGLAIDFCLFIVLIRCGLSATAANIVSASAATAFVYFMSVSRIFSYHSRFVFRLFAAYGIYQIIAILLASCIVGELARDISPPVLAKLAVLPVTFSANFLMMSWLTRRRTTIVTEEENV